MGNKRNKKPAMTNSYGTVIGEYKKRLSPYLKKRKKRLKKIGKEYWSPELFPELFSKKKKYVKMRKKKAKKEGKDWKAFRKEQSLKKALKKSNKVLEKSKKVYDEYGISRERLNELRKK